LTQYDLPHEVQVLTPNAFPRIDSSVSMQIAHNVSAQICSNVRLSGKGIVGKAFGSSINLELGVGLLNVLNSSVGWVGESLLSPVLDSVVGWEWRIEHPNQLQSEAKIIDIYAVETAWYSWETHKWISALTVEATLEWSIGSESVLASSVGWSQEEKKKTVKKKL
jgi:hypothetical protein